MRKDREVRPFHVQCEYTNALLCTCEYGRPKGWDSAKERVYGANAEKLWLLYRRVVREVGRDAGAPFDVSGAPQQMQEPAVFRGQGPVCHVILPRFEPTYPEARLKREHGWSFGELQDTIGDANTSHLMDAALSSKTLKSKALDQPKKAGAEPTPEPERRILLSEARKVLQEKRRLAEKAGVRADQVTRATEEFVERAEDELRRDAAEREDAEGAVAGGAGAGPDGGDASVAAITPYDAFLDPAMVSRAARSAPPRKRRREFGAVCEWLAMPTLVTPPEAVGADRQGQEEGQGEGAREGEGGSTGKVETPGDAGGLAMLLSIGEEAVGLRVFAEGGEGSEISAGPYTVVSCDPESGEVGLRPEGGNGDATDAGRAVTNVNRTSSATLSILDQDPSSPRHGAVQKRARQR